MVRTAQIPRVEYKSLCIGCKSKHDAYSFGGPAFKGLLCRTGSCSLQSVPFQKLGHA